MKKIYLILLFALSYILFSSNKVLGKSYNLKFNSTSEFKILQFTDLHEHVKKNPNTFKLINNILDKEKPDLVVLTGDNLDGNFLTDKSVKKIISNIAKPMEERKIPWAVVLGNHDSRLSFVNRKKQMKIYMSYKYNLSKDFSSVQGRSGDYNLLIKDSKGKKPIFNLYFLDSGELCYHGYGYIKRPQVNWYKKTSERIYKINNKPIPSLMFFHIALNNQNIVWGKSGSTGERNENECSQRIDFNLFDTLIKTRDVKGLFVGHDHLNDYLGVNKGITLGYGRCSGYNGYSKKNYLRGARLFLINEKNPEIIKTSIITVPYNNP